jgi:energy-coupling factor transporter ATP-binding protein EcfA2
MRIVSLQVKNIRGILELTLVPNAKNLVIWGPNGSGKSAVVDAIDFLLTGRISRLMGEGTGGISLKSHGPHIDHKPREASVAALIAISGHASAVSISRTMSAPMDLVYPPDQEYLIKPILELALKGQHVLSRREILKYVAAEGGKRAAEVQALLNLSELEDIRKSFGRVSNLARTDLNNADSVVRSMRGNVVTTLGLSNPDDEALRSAVNKLRADLGGEPLGGFDSGSLKTGLTAPSGTISSAAINPQVLGRIRTSTTSTARTLNETVVRPELELRGLLETLRGEETALREISKLQLMELGLTLLTEDGSCPLCGTRWNPGELRTHLASHISSAKTASERLNKIRAKATTISDAAQVLQTCLSQLTPIATAFGLLDEGAKLNGWLSRLREFTESLMDPVAKYPSRDNDNPEEIARLFAPKDAKNVVDAIVREAEARTPSISPEQAAWDVLTRLEENLKQYETAKQRLEIVSVRNDRAKVLERCFEESRDQVLSSLFGEIEERFSDLYRLIHGEDERNFEGSLRPEGASLIFEVDFYGRGKFPPLALHSEGHQDTMGLCLYLALAERLTRDTIELTVLDDVVMSVDAGHRRKICEVLASQFPNRQFLITTHDHTWARQLKTTGVVPSSNSVEFTRWSLETGPLVGSEIGEPTFWVKIKKDVENNDVPAAAARLRRGGRAIL